MSLAHTEDRPGRWAAAQRPWGTPGLAGGERPHDPALPPEPRIRPACHERHHRTRAKGPCHSPRPSHQPPPLPGVPGVPGSEYVKVVRIQAGGCRALTRCSLKQNPSRRGRVTLQPPRAGDEGAAGSSERSSDAVSRGRDGQLRRLWEGLGSRQWGPLQAGLATGQSGADGEGTESCCLPAATRGLRAPSWACRAGTQPRGTVVPEAAPAVGTGPWDGREMGWAGLAGEWGPPWPRVKGRDRLLLGSPEQGPLKAGTRVRGDPALPLGPLVTGDKETPPREEETLGTTTLGGTPEGPPPPRSAGTAATTGGERTGAPGPLLPQSRPRGGPGVPAASFLLPRCHTASGSLEASSSSETSRPALPAPLPLLPPGGLGARPPRPSRRAGGAGRGEGSAPRPPT